MTVAWSFICSSNPSIPNKGMSLSGIPPFHLSVNSEKEKLTSNFLITVVEKLIGL